MSGADRTTGFIEFIDMALVDYSSSSSGDSIDDEPPAKRRGDSPDSGSNDRDAPAKDAASDMPPLPSTFHDLYASTVRQSVTDDPSLHQGRKRLIPHVPGNWPSHVYVECKLIHLPSPDPKLSCPGHPTNAQHAMLTRLLRDVEKELHHELPLYSFLTSDLGAPLPLHISLSRPMSLPAADKDAFLDRISSSVHASGIDPFSITPSGLAWFRSQDSGRTFLILRVTAYDSSANDMAVPNSQLLALLTRCNAVASQFGQASLYQQSSSEPVGTAFHVSIAWSFGMPGGETSLKALKVLKQRRYAAVRGWEIDVPAVKVKIGNVVNHVPLSGGKTRTVDGGFDR